MDIATYQRGLDYLRGLPPEELANEKNASLMALTTELARTSFLCYVAYTWQMSETFKVGPHTRAIADEIDDAIEKYERGESSYIIVTLCFRHGKSQLISRQFPGYVLGRLKQSQPEIILSTYGQDLSDSMSRDAQNIIKSDEYQQLFPMIKLDPREQGVTSWRIEGSNSKLASTGLGGAFIGKGAHVLILDDYLKNREAAESETIRDKAWNGFTDLMTRIAPVHIVVILATRWHVDDVIGRVLNNNNSQHEDYKPAFPKFSLKKYAARDDDKFHSLPDNPTDEQKRACYLFPERMGVQWYETQFGTLSAYRAASELQGDPSIPGGNMIKTGRVKFNATMPEDLQYCRSWDLASTEKERNSEDPDYTFGICMAVREQMVRDLQGKAIKNDKGEPAKIYHLYIEDGVYCRGEAPERDRLIRATALEDGPEVWQGVEAVAGYKDTFTVLKAILYGIRVVRKIMLKGDKVTRGSKWEPTFEVGNVHFNGHPNTHPWVALVMKHINEFPNGAHDDAWDSIVNGAELCLIRNAEAGGMDSSDFFFSNAV